MIMVPWTYFHCLPVETIWDQGLKKLPVFALTCQKKLGSVGRKIFLFLSIFHLLKKDTKCLLGLNYTKGTTKQTNNEV